MSNYDSKILIQKLDEFIRQYYKNQLIKGVIYFTALVLVAFLTTVILEFFGRYNSLVRGVLFYTFLTFSAYCLSKYLLIPLAHLYRIGKIISYRQASQIVGNHFTEIKDVLLNTLQLNEESKLHKSNLLEAAIEQKTSKLKPISFNAAIDLRNNLKYLRYAVLPVLVYVLILIVSPSMISDSGERIIKYNQTFAVNAPFNFELKNKILEVDQFNDFELKVKDRLEFVLKTPRSTLRRLADLIGDPEYDVDNLSSDAISAAYFLVGHIQRQASPVLALTRGIRSVATLTPIS